MMEIKTGMSLDKFRDMIKEIEKKDKGIRL